MDTRSKILSPAEAVLRLQRFGGGAVVSGFFDPLLAAHARRLESVREAGVPLAVIVNDPPVPILPLRARAELVAALSAVDIVIVPDGSPLPDVSLRFDGRDAEDRARFVEHVRARQA